MSTTEQRHQQVHETEILCLMGDLNSLKRRLQRLTCGPSHATQLQAQVSSWYSTLPSFQRQQVNIVEAPDLLSLTIKATLQKLLISDAKFLSDSTCFCWNKKNSTELKILKRSAFVGERLSSSCSLSSRIFLEYTNITWSSTKPLDYRFFVSDDAPKADIMSLMHSISDGECFMEEPHDSDNIHSLMWLREKSCFSLAQLFVAVLELRIWRCYKKRKKLNIFLNVSRVASSSQIEMVLRDIYVKCQSNVTLFQRVIFAKCTRILRELTSSDDKTVPLYLSIMKKRLMNWNTFCTLPTSESNCKKLWTLHYFATITFILRPLCPGRPLPRQRNETSAVLSNAITRPTHSTSLCSDELFRNLLSVPLLDSFSLLHEFRLLLRDGLIADHHSADLLLNFNENISHPNTIIPTSKKKKSRKKRNKKNVHKSSSSSGNQQVCGTLEASSQREVEENKVYMKSDENSFCGTPLFSSPTTQFAEALAPRDVPRSLVMSTRTMVDIIPPIINCILEKVFSKVMNVIDEENDCNEIDEVMETTSSSYVSTLTTQVVAALIEVSPNSNKLSHHGNENNHNADFDEGESSFGGTSPTRMLCVSPSDSGFYDSLYSLPSWVHADYSGGDDDDDDEEDGHLSLTYFGGELHEHGMIRENGPSDSRSALYFADRISQVSTQENINEPPEAELIHSENVPSVGNAHHQQHTSTVNREDCIVSHQSQRTQQFSTNSSLFMEPLADSSSDRCIGNHLFFQENEKKDNAVDLSVSLLMDDESNKNNIIAPSDSENITTASNIPLHSQKRTNLSNLFPADDSEDYSSYGTVKAPSSTVSNSGHPDPVEESNALNVSHRSRTTSFNSISHSQDIDMSNSASISGTSITTTPSPPAKMRGRSLSPTLASQQATATLKAKGVKALLQSHRFPSPAAPSTTTSCLAGGGEQPHTPLNKPHLSSADSFGSATSDSPPQPSTRKSSHEELFSKGNVMLIFALTCSHMKSQAEGMVLRNIVALQRSLIMYPSAGIAGPPLSHTHPHPAAFPTHVHHSMRYKRVNNSRDLEVMSDDGNLNFSVDRGGRVPSLATGAATVSSLVFNSQLASNKGSDSGSFGHALTMRSVPNSPPILPSESPPPQDNLDLFPPLPTAYPASYMSHSALLPPPPQQQYAHDDEAVSYSHRLRINIDIGPHEYDFVSKRERQGSGHSLPPPFPSPTPSVKSYRPRSASVSRKPLLQTQVETKSMALSRSHSGVNPDLDDNDSLFFESEAANMSVSESSRLRRYSDDAKKVFPRRRSDSDDSDKCQIESAYNPLSYAAYAQNMFNGGGVSGIPTPLTREILSFVEKVDDVGAKMKNAKATAILKLRQVVQQLWPRAQVKAFGSYVTGLSLPSSDLDLVICLPKVHHVAGPSAPGFLEGRNAIKETWQHILARSLKKESWVDVSSMKVISNTAVPVIKLNTCAKHTNTEDFHVSLDISFGGHGHQGLQASKLNVSLIREYPSLRLIVLVLKQFLTRHGLCEVFTGGLSSYAIQLLTARFLQEQPSNVTTDIGASLLGILDFYGNHLQPSVTGISVANMCYFSRKDSKEVLNAIPYSRSASIRRHSLRHDINHEPLQANESYKPYKFDPLFIEDPLDMGNNVGRNCFRIQQVQRVFSDAHKSLLDNISMLERRGYRDCESFSLLNLLVGDLDSLHQESDERL